MGRLGKEYSADSIKSHERTHTRRPSLREQLKTCVQQSDANNNKRYNKFADRQDYQVGKDASSTGQHSEQTSVTVDGHRGINTDNIIGAVVALEHLLDISDPPKKEKETKGQVAERKNQQKKK